MEFLRFDAEIRKWISEKVMRGNLTVWITPSYEEKVPLSVRANLPLARQMKDAVDQIGAAVGVTPSDQAVWDFFSQNKELVSFEQDYDNEMIFREALQETLGDAINAALKMKEEEGQALQTDLLKRHKAAEVLLKEVDEKSEGAASRYQEKLSERLKAYFEGTEDDRLLKEVALFADKVDISEEITRIQHHLKQFAGLVQVEQPAAGKGKALDFLIQEMFREVNTTGAKASDYSVSRLVVSLKTLLEQMREQVQNVE